MNYGFKLANYKYKFLLWFLLLPLFACSKDQGAFFAASLDLQTPKLIISSQQGGSTAVVMYNLNGEQLKVLHDYDAEGGTPRGLIALSPLEFLVSVDGNDHIDKISLVDGVSQFSASTGFSGTLYQAAKHDDYGLFFIESNTLEAFDLDGVRSGNPRIGTTVGSCQLNVPRGMTFNQQGQLIVVNTGNDDINVYDVSDPATPTCVRANTTLGNVDPVAVLAHSDGFLYVGTQGDDRIYRFAGDGSGTGTVIFNDSTRINNPSAIVEMPDGSLLVASDGTNAIINIRTDGTMIGITNLIQDAYTNSINQMIILQESTR
ncbi:MAG: hypothetical protein H6623_09665 [Bdellovibrionaceae bacterium]|nr:hypothetical protein [Pseudobdellovibrionaceae bacterium]